MADSKTEKSSDTVVGVVDDEVEQVISASEETPLNDADTTEGDGDMGEAGALAGQLMSNPRVLAALQGRLEGMIGTRSGYIENLPKVVKRRIKALKKLQFEMVKVESEFYKEVHELECKYAAKYAPIFDRRCEVVSGGIEPTDSDCDWPSDDEDEEDKKLINKAKVDEVAEKATAEDSEKEKKDTDGEKDEENVNGVPEFWLTIFKNVDMLSDMIQEHDEPILKHLHDIKVQFQETNPMGFTLEFFFNENEHFTNRVLTKQYIMRAEPDEEDPFGFEGPEIIKCNGCTIDWNKGKNITVKLVKKTQKHKGRGTKRTVTKTVQADSFFNFFNPPETPEGTDMDDETESLLAADFEIGHYIRERIVPRAVLYFTGEALDDDDFDEEDEEEEDGDDDDDDDDDDYDEDNDPDFKPKAGKDGGQAGDCKQQ